MSRTPVLLDDDEWARVLDALGDDDDEGVRDCRETIAAQVRDGRSDCDSGDHQETLDADTAFELLSDPVRRELLWTCRERGTMSVDDLVDAVAGELDSDRDRVGVDLHHTHIPKLSDAGVLTVESDTVQYGGDRLLDCLAAVDRE
ncbi:helix-turn-helix domain-containing protein [Halobacterium zhouii]|uniref:helix-turn-helix domain-containing protein n=1 Tax=Halobacterium zhouii TaxID=2902624 RepID=UPI001E5BA3CF|nr:helix-turn-helix domain-containing protein [Halobacterium zhouii]